MKKIIFTLSLFVCVVASLFSQSISAKQPIDYTHLNDKSFTDLFVEITPDELPESVFTLFAKDYAVITAGFQDKYNSMVASDGGVGRLCGKAVTFCCLRGTRYTLEMILKDKEYTMSYFDDQFKPAFLPFGKSSGRNTDKMKTTTLTPLVTPSGRMSYKEAKLIIECELAQTQTINPDEIYDAKNKDFFEKAHQSEGVYHKLVFGNIVHVWVRK